MKGMKKTTKIRIFYMASIVVADVLFLPWVLKFPEFLVQDLGAAPQLWFEYGFINALKDLLIDDNLRTLFFACQGLVLALLIGIGWNVMKLGKKNRIRDGVGGPESSGDGQMGTARWQNEKEMDSTVNTWTDKDTPKKAGLILGSEVSPKGKEKFWGNFDDAHTVTIGATRSGKGRRIILPSIYEMAKAGESFIFGDPKGELFITTADYLKEQGYNVIVLNFREPQRGNQWNILNIVNEAVKRGDIAKATELAWDIADAFTNDEGSKGEKIWKNGESATIAGLILATCLEGDFEFQKHMSTAYYLLSELGQEDDEGGVALNDFFNSLNATHPAKGAFASAMLASPKTRASFFTQALSTLRLFSDPNIADMTSKQDHDLKSIGIDKTAVFLIIPDEKQTRNVLATLYISQVYQSLIELSNERGGRIPRRVNMILDEFGNLPAIPNFAQMVTVGASRGIRFNVFIQGVGQLKKLYDKDTDVIMGNCYNWIFLRTADYETAKLISDKTGKYTVETDSSSSSVQGGKGGHSMSHSSNLTGRNLLMPDEVLRWDVKESLVLTMGQFPARYPLQDIGKLKANKAFGYINSGDIDKDKAHAINMIKERWDRLQPRKLEEVNIWLPSMASSICATDTSCTDTREAEVDNIFDDEDFL